MATKTTMKAVVLDSPGPASELQIRKIPVPTPAPGGLSSQSRPSASTGRSCTPDLVSPKG